VLILNNYLMNNVYIIVITSYIIIFIITAFNYLYCLLSTPMKKHFWLASLNQVSAAVSVSWLWC